eukprot:Amastigsp_a346754_16.p6 type:complete len:139 gc:universal Amastigsp_a346754_16:1407-1823(+)
MHAIARSAPAFARALASSCGAASYASKISVTCSVITGRAYCGRTLAASMSRFVAADLAESASSATENSRRTYSRGSLAHSSRSSSEMTRTGNTMNLNRSASTGRTCAHVTENRSACSRNSKIWRRSRRVTKNSPLCHR